RLVVDEDVDRLSGQLVQLDHRPRPEVEHFADALARAPELHGNAQVDVEDEVDVGDWLARRRLAEGRKLSGAHTAGLDAAASRAGSEPSRCATTHAQSSKRRRL